MRLRHACWVIIVVLIAGPSHAGRREAIRDLDFATFRIDLLPFEFTVPRYEFTHCASDLYPTMDVIEARIETSDGESWAHVYQMLAPKEGGSVECAATKLNVHEYCYRSRSPSQASKVCGTLSFADLNTTAYRAKPDPNASPEHLYATIDGTLVVFVFSDKITWDEIGQVLEAIESMTLVTPRELLSYTPKRSTAGKRQVQLTGARAAKAHADRIPFSKLLPKPRPHLFDRVQGYAYWNKYGLEFQTNRSGEHSQLRIEFSETARLPRLKTCWSGRACDLVATTRTGRKIYSTWTDARGNRRGQKLREYYVDVEGTLVVLSWPHWTRSEGKPVFRSHEFAPNELETLIDSLKFATSSELIRFPNMSVMGSYGGSARVSRNFSTGPVMAGSTSDIQIVTTPVQSNCVRIHDDGSIEAVGNIHIDQSNSPRRCAP